MTWLGVSSIVLLSLVAASSSEGSQGCKDEVPLCNKLSCIHPYFKDKCKGTCEVECSTAVTASPTKAECKQCDGEVRKVSCRIPVCVLEFIREDKCPLTCSGVCAKCRLPSQEQPPVPSVQTSTLSDPATKPPAKETLSTTHIESRLSTGHSFSSTAIVLNTNATQAVPSSSTTQNLPSKSTVALSVSDATTPSSISDVTTPLGNVSSSHTVRPNQTSTDKPMPITVASTKVPGTTTDTASSSFLNGTTAAPSVSTGTNLTSTAMPMTPSTVSPTNVPYTSAPTGHSTLAVTNPTSARAPNTSVTTRAAHVSATTTAAPTAAPSTGKPCVDTWHLCSFFATSGRCSDYAKKCPCLCEGSSKFLITPTPCVDTWFLCPHFRETKSCDKYVKECPCTCSKTK